MAANTDWHHVLTGTSANTNVLTGVTVTNGTTVTFDTTYSGTTGTWTSSSPWTIVWNEKGIFQFRPVISDEDLERLCDKIIEEMS